MNPWEFLAWAVAVSVSLIVVALAIVVVIAGVRTIGSKTVRVERKRRTVAVTYPHVATPEVKCQNVGIGNRF